MSGYAHSEENDLAHRFQCLDARVSRLAGLKNAFNLVEDYVDGAADQSMYRAVIAKLIAAETRKPRPMGLAGRRVARARKSRKVAK